MRRFAVGLLILISALCLVVSCTSLWLRHNIINTDVFVSNVETIVDQPQVEARINDRVTATVMTNPQVQDAIDSALTVLPPRLQQFRPTVENGIRSLVSAGVGKLLADDPFRPLTQAALISAHDQLVAGQPVRFTLGQAKNLVPAGAKDGLAGQVLALVPDDVGITLLTPADAPRVYNAIDLLKSVWWWLGLVALATIAGALGISHRRRGSLRAWSVTTTVLGLAVLVTLRVARGPLVAQAKPGNRDALGAIYDILAQSLRSWMLWLVGLALLVLVGTLVWGRLGIVAGARRGVRSARGQIAARRAVQAAAPAGTTGSAVEGQPVPVAAAEPWYRRIGADVRAFLAGLGLDERAAGLGVLVRGHLRPARWTGIVVGVVLLLLWPSPTLSVLVWIGALVALYLGALEWLQSRAPEAAEGTTSSEVRVAGNGVPAPSGPVPSPSQPGAPVPQPTVPVARSTPDDARTAVLAAPARAESAVAAVDPGPAAVARVPAPRAPASAQTAPPPAPAVAAAPTTPEVLTTLSDRLTLLDRLDVARGAGILTDEEFGREKDRVLAL